MRLVLGEPRWSLKGFFWFSSECNGSCFAHQSLITSVVTLRHVTSNFLSLGFLKNGHKTTNHIWPLWALRDSWKALECWPSMWIEWMGEQQLLACTTRPWWYFLGENIGRKPYCWRREGNNEIILDSKKLYDIQVVVLILPGFVGLDSGKRCYLETWISETRGRDIE